MTGADVRVPVVLFDWGDTLIWIPGMLNDPDQHLACVERIYAQAVRPHLDAEAAEMPVEDFLDAYLQACRRQIAQSKRTLREHSFEDRFALACELAGIRTVPPRAAFSAMANALGEAVVQGARLLDDVPEVIDELAQSYRLGLVSNYPHAPVIPATLKRFGLLQHFDVIVVSCDTGWMKPHAACYHRAIEALPAPLGKTMMVGDDLTNDVKGAKALGLHTVWIAPRASVVDPAVDIHMPGLAELPAHCARVFA
jgi:HAD superfamily hydrolase (TIGR01549 family)